MEEKRPGLLGRLRERLSRTNEGLIKGIDRVLLGKKKIDDDVMETLEEVLIGADLGVKTAYNLLEGVEDRIRRRELGDTEALKGALREEMLRILEGSGGGIPMNEGGPTVIMVVGVNGVGKTTTIGKLAARFKADGKKVLMAAGDTFRAAAIDQLKIWGERNAIPVISHQDGADPAAVAYDAVEAARARGMEILLLDTAGRLHTKTNLMEELKKVKRVLSKIDPQAPHEVLLILDGSTGQNAVSQAKLFHEAVGVTGLVVTKLDGTPKGGVVIGIADELKLPIRYIGIGEGVEDLREFSPEEFVAAIF